MENCICANCQTIFVSTTRIVMNASEVKMLSTTPCPNCGKSEVTKSTAKK